MEKKKSSNAATNYIAEIDEDKKDQIRKFFPAYFSEDIKDMEEEYEYFVSELTNLMSENKDDEKIQNYIIAKATILRNQCPFVSISKIYHNFLSQMKVILQFYSENLFRRRNIQTLITLKSPDTQCISQTNISLH